MTTATALANPNIAFIKYWGNLDATLRIPANGSISMNLDGLETRTTVTFDADLAQDQLILNGQSANEDARRRVSLFLDRVRTLASLNSCAKVVSQNNFPTGAGMASSASAFAALSLAASAAAGLQVDERECSRLARRGSGSACRSVPGGFVEWTAGSDDESSYACSLAPAEHWDLVDCVAVVSQAHKPTGSTQGHALADSSPLQAVRVASAAGRLETCRKAILQRDFSSLAAVAELDCNLMHAVMMTSQPPLLYWQPATLAIMHAVQEWRAGGLPVFYTIDAGPNAHVLCPAEASPEVTGRLRQIEGVKEVLSAHPGGPARLI
jgi:diphosphomevalonate decarboxylase